MKAGDFKKHRWMLCGTVYFQLPAEEEGKAFRFEVPLNVISESKDNFINAHRLGQAQQMLQLRGIEKLGQPEAQVVDVVLHSASYLGCMTEKEWTFQPPVPVSEDAPLVS